MDHSSPGSSVHGISQARKLEWVAISFSGGSSRQPVFTGSQWWLPSGREHRSRGSASSAKVWALERTDLGWNAASLHPSRVAFGESFYLSESQAFTYKMGTMIPSISWSWWELNIGKHLVPSMHAHGQCSQNIMYYIFVMNLLDPFLVMDGEREVVMSTLEAWSWVRTLVQTYFVIVEGPSWAKKKDSDKMGRKGQGSNQTSSALCLGLWLAWLVEL